MASLLREQTRIKESLEVALERQKEGMFLAAITFAFVHYMSFIHDQDKGNC